MDLWQNDTFGASFEFFPPRAYRESLGRIMETDLFGVRLGIYKKATESNAKRAKRPGTYSAAQCGVLLAAAEYAVELSEQDSQRAPFGDSKSPFYSRPLATKRIAIQ